MAILGIDIGAQNSVLATINRGTVSVVRNELADRLTPSLVLFSEGHRLMGDHAAPLVKSHAGACCRSFKNLLGEFFDESSRAAAERKFQLAELTSADDGLAGFKVVVGDSHEVFPATRVCAAFLTKLKQVAEASMQRSVSEVVIACPSWYRIANREALLDAANIAGLRCLRVISDMAATVLDYGLYRRQHFSPESKTIVAFISLGHSASAVCIAAFTTSGAEILAEVSNPNLGGRDMDRLITSHFASAFQKQHGVNPLNNVKARLKMEDQAERTKKILSANSETTFSIECLLEDNDISGHITRELFEELCAETFKPALLSLFQEAMNIAGMETHDILFVEAVGGGTRIPWIQRCVAEAFGKELSRTLASDECVARGCALQAAMSSLHFKVKEFDFGEKLWNPIAITWTGEGPVAVDTSVESDMQMVDNSSALCGLQSIEIAAGTPTNTMRKLSFIRNSSFELYAAYRDITDRLKSGKLGACRVELPPNCGLQKVHVFCALNYNGILRFTRACMSPLESENQTAPGEQAEGDKDGAMETDEPTDNTASKAVEGGGKAAKTKQMTELTLKWIPHPGHLSQERLVKYREAELQQDNEDRVFKERQDLLNELETLVYSVRDGIGGAMGSFTTTEEAAALRSMTDGLELWVYDHQDDTQLSKSAITMKLDELKALARAPRNRMEQKELRQGAAERLRGVIQEARQLSTSGSPDFSHIEPEMMKQLFQSAVADEGWLNKVIEEAASLPPTMDSPLLAEEIDQRTSDLLAIKMRIISTPKPKPPQGHLDEADMDFDAGQNCMNWEDGQDNTKGTVDSVNSQDNTMDTEASAH